MTAGPASMLPATEKSSPDVWPHQSTQALPVCAAMRPVAIHHVDLTLIAALIAAVSALTISSAACRPARNFMP